MNWKIGKTNKQTNKQTKKNKKKTKDNENLIGKELRITPWFVSHAKDVVCCAYDYG